MTFLKHDPSTFAAKAAQGFSEVHSSLVRQVPGGVTRVTRSESDEVAVVIGGGSGHYPAFAGQHLLVSELSSSGECGSSCRTG